jgi:hypothetical protein
MAKKETEIKGSAISLKRLSEKTKINYMKIWNNLHGNYNSMTDQEKTQIVNAFHDEVTPLLKKLGFFVVIKRIKDPG